MKYGFNENKTKVNIDEAINDALSGDITCESVRAESIIGDEEVTCGASKCYNTTMGIYEINKPLATLEYNLSHECGELRIYEGSYATKPSVNANGYTGKIECKDLAVSEEQIKCVPSYKQTTTSAANVYINSAGAFSRHVSSSSKTIKHDIKPLEDEGINAKKLYDVDVIQCKYNDGIVSKNDPRHGKDFPAFIIEDLAEKYPIAVDMIGDVKEWTWNPQYLIPPMLELIQEQKKAIDELKEEVEKLKGNDDK